MTTGSRTAPARVGSTASEGAAVRRAAAALGRLASYPVRGRREADLARARQCLLEADAAEAADALELFAAAVAHRSFEELEDLYTRTFDLAPRCAPYLSVHLFGQESYRRARLMTGLAEAYSRSGFDRGTELPDHLAMVLQAAEGFPDDEWRDLVAKVLGRALARMQGSLGVDEPYRHLLQAVRLALGVADLPEEAPPGPLWKRREAARSAGGAP